jgi:5'-3' exonuclease
MGIKSNYNKFLKEYGGEHLFKNSHLSEFRFKKIAIDTSIYLYKFKACMGDNWMNGFFNMVQAMRRHLIHCVFIFDGVAPKEKNLERVKRNESKLKLQQDIKIFTDEIAEFHKTGIVTDFLNNKVGEEKPFDISEAESLLDKKQSHNFQIHSSDFVSIRSFLDIMKIPYYTATEEAEKFCSQLCINNLVDAVLSDDTDVMAYKCPVVLSKLNSYNGSCVVVRHTELLEALELSPAQFLDHCIMCGTDYNNNIPKVGSVTSYNYIRKYKTIESIQTEGGLDITCLNHERVRVLFTEFINTDLTNVPYCGIPDFDKLSQFSHDNGMFLNIEDFKQVFSEWIIFN